MWCKIEMLLMLGPKKNMCVSGRPADPNIFYAKKKNRSAKSGNSFPTSKIFFISLYI